MKELPEGWEWRKLNEIKDKIMTGTTPPSKYDKYFNGDIQWYTPEDLGERLHLSSSKRTITNLAIKEKKARLYEEETLLITCIGNIGRTGVVKEKASSNQQIAGIKFIEEVLPEYVHYCFALNSKVIQQMSPSAVVPILNQSNLLRIKIPLPFKNGKPDLEKQKKIVTLLEKAERTKRLHEQAEVLVYELLKSVFYDMFGDPVKNEKGWDKITLEDLSSHIVDCPHSTPLSVEGKTEYPCIRTSELKNGYIDWSSMKYIDEEGYLERIKRIAPIEGDIIYGREGTFGEAIRVPKNVKMSLGQRTMLFRPNPKLCNSEFLWALIRSKGIYYQALRKTSGSTVGHINVGSIKKFKGIHPPLELQTHFAYIVKILEEIKKQLEVTKHESEILFKALLQKAFAGELIA